MDFTKASAPTLYFIGVTTTQSSIMKIFPVWTKELGIDGARIRGFDLPLHADRQAYRDVVQFIRDDELAKGALVTTHKIDLYNACRDMFGYLDPYAQQLSEMSSISKRGGVLRGHAKDPITSGLAIEAFVPDGYWARTGGEVVLLGCGGAAVAMCVYFAGKRDDTPKRIVICGRSQRSIDHAKAIVAQLDTPITFEFIKAGDPETHDRVIGAMPPYSLIVNATGLGKDAPGSPITDDCPFPQHAIAWEINYRGALDFLHQAQALKEARDLTVVDGWFYFIHGWCSVISEVFDVAIDDDLFYTLSNIAKEYQNN